MILNGCAFVFMIYIVNAILKVSKNVYLKKNF